ncbi:MAG: trimeric intracellular cation channel family protein [Altererythrobacter sp.]|nr:trimeric intracellular cation channel family protein [Altererythrobacter sp.]
MNAAVLTPLLDWLDLAGVAVFALTGALAAARARQTFVTLAFFALLTGVGGGSVRDLLIGAPVFWVHDGWVAAVCLAAAALVWITPIRWWHGALIDYADALGLAAYAVLGSAKALSYGVPPIPAFVMGVVTGCVGGIIRDVVAGRPSIIMRPELYVTAAALSAALCVAGTMIGIPREPVWIAAAAAGFALRAAAIRWRLALPAYRTEREDKDQGRGGAGGTDEPSASPGSGPPG